MLKIFYGLSILALASPAYSADIDFTGFEDVEFSSSDDTVKLYGSFGALFLKASEHVYTGAGSSDNLSLLVWEGTSPLATIGIDVKISDKWKLKAKAQGAMSGNSYMENTDWIAPFNPSFASDDWSHKSKHDNTNLDWYLKGSVAVGYDFDINDNLTFNLNGGIKYTDIKWTAKGGDYTYSVAGLRDTTGTFPDIDGISYRQQLPSIFLGLDTEIKKDNWTLRADAQAGVTFAASAVDWHWMRVPPLRFEETLNIAPTLALSVEASYSATDYLDIFIAADVEKYFLARSDTTIYNNVTNVNLGKTIDASGAELLSSSISAGIKGVF